MKYRFAFRWLVVLFGLLSLLACSPQAVPLPTATLPAATLEALATPSDVPVLPTQPPVIYEPSGPAIEHLAGGQTIAITYIHMISVDIGWAIGGQDQASDHVFWTDDGALTWHDVTPPEPAPAPDQPVAALGFFKTTSSAWVVYGPADYGMFPPVVYVWYTHDSGETWQYGTVDTSVSSEAFSPWYLTFADDQHGWLMVFVGAGMMHNYVVIFATSDGGATWIDILDPYTDMSGIQSFPKTDMVFMDAQTGWLTRDGVGVDFTPHVFRTTDGGVTWARIDLPAPSAMPNLFTEYAYYCGTYSANRFSLDSAIFALKCVNSENPDTQLNFQYTTTDGGRTWQIFRLPDDYLISATNDGLLYFDPNYGFALGRNMYQTTDGGANWTLIKQVAWDGQFSFVNMNTGWAVARNEQDLALVKTSTGGAKWEIINPFVTP
jgi:photosystem II stability/assembly factor-like uncharacterized protein